VARDGLAMPGPAKCNAIITKEIFIGLVPVLLLLLTIKQIHLCAGSGLESKLFYCIQGPLLCYILATLSGNNIYCTSTTKHL